jgi:hypothetical protein
MNLSRMFLGQDSGELAGTCLVEGLGGLQLSAPKAAIQIRWCPFGLFGGEMPEDCWEAWN